MMEMMIVMIEMMMIVMKILIMLLMMILMMVPIFLLIVIGIIYFNIYASVILLKVISIQKLVIIVINQLCCHLLSLSLHIIIDKYTKYIFNPIINIITIVLKYIVTTFLALRLSSNVDSKILASSLSLPIRSMKKLFKISIPLVSRLVVVVVVIVVVIIVRVYY